MTSMSSAHTRAPRVIPLNLNVTEDGDAFRAAMRKVTAGVAVITTHHDDQPWGMTVSSFTAVSMEPPTLLVCVNRKTATARDIERDHVFGVNLLSQAQQTVSQLCANPGECKFLHDHVVAPDDLPVAMKAPVLSNSLASFDCAVTKMFSVGTHFVVIARVVAVMTSDAIEPLLYGQGKYLHGVAIDELAALRAARA
ncbi:flavin reductase family protein [Sphingomonadales bacterium 56]|uniref:Flavin reductase n=1 Tax=Sphingobium indicum TaxID=332055 RepID=A0A4Q4ITM2_9SPHN|nr:MULTISPECIES: flavin reductase family protein [Sphingobium]MBY2930688.1 flavin reductase family protein [Sphingomonadales bacterium 56]MBY2960770.1 flavin reductase family protein [Sphingomonadales bacterium 58]NYI24992.1 flavin reductase (DIM6/NTAB) family NADH-FMN oxidoreductase RutF [Sphingobium indicum]RYL96732.1 flavin reductase [Sphingobium indicum]CAD7341761.1 FMN reductase (NADH) RutF [Sphingobium sp. S6]